MLKDFIVNYLDPNFVREEELAAIIQRKSPLPVRRFQQVTSNGGNALLNFQARSRAITVIDLIDIYLFQAIGCVGGYNGQVQFDIQDNYTRSWTLASNEFSAAGAVNIHYLFGRFGASRILNDTQCELIPMPYNVLLPDERLRIQTTVVADANTASQCQILYREFDLD